MSEAETLKLFERFKTAAGGDAAAGAMILLAHSQLSQREQAKPAPADVLTVAEAADALGVSADTIYDLCGSGRLRHARIGGKGRGVIRIRRADLAKIESESTREEDNGLALFRKHCS